MFSKRTLLKALGGAVLAAGLSAGLTSGAATAADVTLRMHQFLPPQANVPKHILTPWIEKVQAASNGKLEIQHFPAMQLGGKPPQLIDQAIDGIADIVWTVAGYTPGRFPTTEVFELPFMMTNAEAASRAYWQLAESRNLFETEFKDFHVIGLWVHGPGMIHSKKPIMSVEDLNGVKLRAPTRTTNMLFKNLGATPVGMPVPAIPEAMSKGVIDATVIPWEIVGALKVHEMAKNHTTFGDASLYTATFLFAMNKDKYNSLPADLKAAIDANSGADFSAWAGKTMQAYDDPSYQKAKAAGNNIITLDSAKVDAWRKAAQGTTDAWVKEMDAAGKDGSGLLAEAKALIKKNSGM